MVPVDLGSVVVMGKYLEGFVCSDSITVALIENVLHY